MGARGGLEREKARRNGRAVGEGCWAGGGGGGEGTLFVLRAIGRTPGCGAPPTPERGGGKDGAGGWDNKPECGHNKPE